MRLITLHEPISFIVTRSTGEFKLSLQAYTPYVMSNSIFNQIYIPIEKILFKQSWYDYRLPGLSVHNIRRGEKLIYFNGSGGFGDQIMSWPVVKILVKLGFEVHVAVEPGLELCWWHLPFVKSVISMPIQQSQLEMWPHMLLMDAVVNFDEHPDQLHPVDVQLTRFGIDPNSVDPELKVTAPVFTAGELEKASKLVVDGTFALYQLASTSPTRSLLPERSLEILFALADRFRHIQWIAIHDKFVDSDLVAKAGGSARKNVVVTTFAELRVLWATVTKARLCVGPDSMLVHAAGAAGIPAVGIWGPMHPMNRVRYYKNHVPIWHQNACQFAPCFASTHKFPNCCPPLPEPRKTCSVLGQVTADEVCQAAAKFL